MLATDLPDHRRTSERALLAALQNRDALALAEAYHRTTAAAYTCARRLLSSHAEIEALLREVYAELWTSPPADPPLERWVRSRCFAWAAAHLRERGAAPAAASAALLFDDAPDPDIAVLDHVEQALAEFDDDARRALVLAHDKGVPSSEQPGEHAAEDLERALATLASADNGAAAEADERRRWPLADWALGLLDPEAAAEVVACISDDADCAARARLLQRGRRVLEGLPPTPDLGQRVLVAVLAAAPAGSESDPPLPSALDEERPAQAEAAPDREGAPSRARPRERSRPQAAAPRARPGRPPLRAKPGQIPGEPSKVDSGDHEPGSPADEDQPAERPGRWRRVLLRLGLLAVAAAGAAAAAYLYFDLQL